MVNGHGSEVGATMASSPRIAKVGFTGETTTGRQIMQYAAENLIPRTMLLSRPGDVRDPPGTIRGTHEPCLTVCA